MIYIRLAGGLGNQLFQLAAGLEIQSKTSMPITIYKGGLSRYAAKRDASLLSLIKLPDNIIICEKETFAVKLLKYRIGRLNLPFCINDNTIHKIKQQPFYLVDGYFQDIKYIKQGVDLLKKLIEETIQSNIEIQDLFLDITKDSNISEFCALHIRRGDYTDNQTIYPLLGKNYYLSGLKKTENNTKTLVLFSDDKSIEFDFFENYKIIRISELNLSDYQEFQLLTLFKNIIIANSTFSFWAAICNKKIKTRKIAPTLWTWIKFDNNQWINNLLSENFETINYNEFL
jgi:hypothetical protein